jgi:excisionase family DNA binding protein
METLIQVPLLLRISTVAQIVDAPEKTVYTWIRRGHLPAVDTPGGKRVRADVLQKLIESGEILKKAA